MVVNHSVDSCILLVCESINIWYKCISVLRLYKTRDLIDIYWYHDKSELETGKNGHILVVCIQSLFVHWFNGR